MHFDVTVSGLRPAKITCSYKIQEKKISISSDQEYSYFPVTTDKYINKTMKLPFV